MPYTESKRSYQTQFGHWSRSPFSKKTINRKLTPQSIPSLQKNYWFCKSVLKICSRITTSMEFLIGITAISDSWLWPWLYG